MIFRGEEIDEELIESYCMLIVPVSFDFCVRVRGAQKICLCVRDNLRYVLLINLCGTARHERIPDACRH